MLRPVGSLPPGVYWRRRMLVVLLPAALVALLGYLLRPGGEQRPTAAPVVASSSSSAESAAATPLTPTPATGTPTATQPGTTQPGSTQPGAGQPPSDLSSTSPADSTTTSSTSSSTTADGQPCDPQRLTISAQPSAAAFKVGDQPVLYLQVVNPGPRPCTQDLADRQVELRIYRGASRVWGSHDCMIQPGTDVRTLAVGSPVRIGVPWSGLSSQPDCAGVRQPVGAGSYTLHALLAGTEGTPATFTIS